MVLLCFYCVQSTGVIIPISPNAGVSYCLIPLLMITELELLRMATQFVRWWKTKFHIGGCAYKTMSVLGSNLSDGRPSDTEDLVRDDASSYNNEVHINPCLISPAWSNKEPEEEEEDHPSIEDPEEKLQDIQCDVHVEDGVDSDEEKKEFSFTFYDLDGYGKLTKDDVAGLVRSIYGAVNDSIKVPSGGKKTIKVKLTVTPEKSGSVGGEENINNNNNCQPSSPIMGNRNSMCHNERQSPVDMVTKENLHRTRCSRKEKEKCFSSDKPRFNSMRIPNSTLCQGCLNISPEVFRECSASPLRNRKKWTERMCSFCRPELIDLIKENMEKNNVSSCCRHEPTHRQKHSINHKCISNPVNNVNGNENLWKQKLLNVNIAHNGSYHRHSFNLGSNKVHECHNQKPFYGNPPQKNVCKKHGHHTRSRSHDLTQNLGRHHPPHTNHEELVTQPSPSQFPECCTNKNNYIVNNIKNHENTTETQYKKLCHHHHSSPRNKNTNVPPNSSNSPHQNKHRNREVEHARAMAQVISWLERENIGGGDKKFSSPRRKGQNSSNPCRDDNSPSHQHHVHEHIHHHYHHYAKETPIIV